MKTIWNKIGTLMYWLTWPGLVVYLRLHMRTRVAMIADNKVLVVKGWLGDGRWHLPGGGLHRHEDTEMGAVREVYEETGIILDAKQLTFMFKERFTEHHLGFRYFCYKVQYAGEITIVPRKGEIVDAQWITLESLNATNARQDVVRALASLQE